MKCPERFIINQFNVRKPIMDDENVFKGETHLLIETQGFCECYKENCAAWDKEKQICKKVK